MADTNADIPDTPQEVFKLLPAKARLAVFSAAALAGLALTAITTGIAAVHAPSPQWLTIALAVFPVVTSGLGILAGSNIQKPTTTSAPVTESSATVPSASVGTTPLLADAPTASTESESRPVVAAGTEPAQATTAADVAAAYAATLTAAPEATPTA